MELIPSITLVLTSKQGFLSTKLFHFIQFIVTNYKQKPILGERFQFINIVNPLKTSHEAYDEQWTGKEKFEHAESSIT